MKKITSIGASLLFATTLAVSASAVAQPRDRDDDEPRRGWQHRDDGDRDAHRYRRYERDRHARHDRDDDDDDDDDDRRRYERRYYAPRAYRPAYVYVAPRGYAVDRWRVGSRMPPPFYASRYHVDPYAYRLDAPPRGYRWVRVDRDAYLVSIASGVISNVLYDIFR
ncbi:MAG TPA: RcnB family protein [Lysobacter sp.]